MTSIFIVEDDPDLQVLYKKMLTKAGFEIAGVANNGEVAVKNPKILKGEFDIVILDHRMPVMDGLETVKEILKIDKKSKIIYASADYTVKEQVLNLGVKMFLSKPFSFQKLVTAISEITIIKQNNNTYSPKK